MRISRIRLVGSSGGGGTTYTTTITGSLTPTGSATGLGHYAATETGSIAITGGLLRNIFKVFGGNIAMTGEPSKKTTHTATGSLTPTGISSIAASLVQAISGSLTPTGSLANRGIFVAALTGSTALTGGVLKKIRKVFSGSIGTTGANVKKTTKHTEGSVTPTGASIVLLNIKLTVSATLSLVGSLATQKLVFSPSVAGAARRLITRLMGRR